MSTTTEFNLDDYPALVDFVRTQYDETRSRWVLQAPERILVMDETSKEIVDRCDGTRSAAMIIDGLAGEYDAPRDVIEHDVIAVLKLLSEKMFLVMR